MDLRSYFLLLRTRWWIICVITIVLTLGTYFVSAKVLKKEYTATATFEVNIPNTQTAGSSVYEPALVATDAELVTSVPVMQQTMTNLGLAHRHVGAVGSTTCTPSNTSQTFACSTTSTDPALAAAMLNELGKVAIQLNTKNQEGQLRPLLDEVRKREASVSADIANLSRSLSSASSNEALAINNQIAADNTALNALQTQELTLRQSMAAATSSIIPVNPASAPTSPSYPRTVLNTVLAFLLGLMLGGGAVVVLDYFDDSPRTVEDIEAAAGGPVLASVTRIDAGRAGGTLPLLSSPRSSASEAYRMLRTNVQFASVDRPARMLLVTSSRQGDGKTTTSVNLAIAFAQAGVRVILVDGDLRRPSVHKVLRIDNRVGLLNLLLQGTDLDVHAALRDGPVAGLKVLTTGPIPPNPSELLASGRMRSVMATLGATADLVIVDSPPVLAVADALILASLADGVVLVADGEHTKMHMIRQSASALSSAGARVLGIVMNRVTPRSHYYSYYRDAYGYGDSAVDPAAGSNIVRLG